MATTTSTNLKEAWAAFRAAHPGVRSRNAARRLGVSEAELIAAGCGENVTRLKPDWEGILFDLESLGEVMALTRNEVFVHEKVGRYRNVEMVPSHQMGMVLDEGIDLRIAFRHWHIGFAVVEEAPDRVKRSLHFYDQSGTAVHKVHLRRPSNVAAFDEIVARYCHDDQSPHQAVTPLPSSSPERSDHEIDVAGLRQKWSELQDTHDFIFLLRAFNVTRTQALRLAAPEMAVEVTTDSFRRVIETVATAEMPIMVFVSSRGCTQIHIGPVHKLKVVNDWFNVLDPGFNLHVRDDLIHTAWIVRKPTKDGIVTSLELFDEDGTVLAYLFGKRKEGRLENAAWRDLLGTLPRVDA